MKKGWLVFIFVFFLFGNVYAAQCSNGAITSACECEGTTYEVGYCCDLTNTPGGIFFDPGYSSCPSGNWYYVDPSNPSASDSNAGTNPNLPWSTLKHATNVVTAGSTVIVKAGTYIDSAGDIDSAFDLTNSGTSGNPIIIKSYPKHAAIIERYVSYNPGFRINDNYVIIDGFDVRGTLGTHYSTGVVIKNNDVSVGSTEGDGEHENLKYGILLYASDHCLVENNYVHDIFSNSQDGNYNTGALEVLGMNIHYSEFNIIQHNYVDAGTTVYAAYGQKGEEIFNNTWRYNIAINSYKAFYGRGSTGSVYTSEDNYYYQNLAIDSNTAFYLAQVNYRYRIFNNLIYNVNRFTETSQVTTQVDHNFWNNLVITNDYCYTRGVNDGFYGMIHYSDYNSFDCPIMGYLGYESGGTLYYNTLNDWRTLGYDTHSISQDALTEFVDYANEDFHLNPDSTFRTLGIDKQDYDNDGDVLERIPVGPYITGDEIIGIIDYSTQQAEVSKDVNKDGEVNIVDLALAIFNQKKVGEDYIYLDLNSDGEINWQDVLIIAVGI